MSDQRGEIVELAAADTRALLTEVALRMEYQQNSLKGRDLGRLCLEAIANLDRGVLASTRGRPWSTEQLARFDAYLGSPDGGDRG